MERSGEGGSSSSVSGESTLLPLQNPNISANSTAIRRPRWPTIDGPIGLSEEESVVYARRFYKFGFLLLPWLWAVNCFYFWPVLRHSHSFPSIRRSGCSYNLQLLKAS
ncbi:probable gamma-secretase subunit PEN-2 [Chenopodium quinoa]|uniref:probable gamma-secretase subunit PEN-2 n=1 Tax=Chenopodium quinoa TaxID=63459 RepID=UPI000B790C65|nr:probable gamma-secretase subunit PEN-2 [Chenopodium quinoa]